MGVAHNFQGSGVMMGMYNTRQSVEGFASACFEYALGQGFPLYFSSKSSVLSEYDGMFVDVFDTMYETSYRKAFEDAGLWYRHLLINDLVSKAIKSNGGFVWACKN